MDDIPRNFLGGGRISYNNGFVGGNLRNRNLAIVLVVVAVKSSPFSMSRKLDPLILWKSAINHKELSFSNTAHHIPPEA